MFFFRSSGKDTFPTAQSIASGSVFDEMEAKTRLAMVHYPFLLDHSTSQRTFSLDLVYHQQTQRDYFFNKCCFGGNQVIIISFQKNTLKTSCLEIGGGPLFQFRTPFFKLRLTNLLPEVCRIRYH